LETWIADLDRRSLERAVALPSVDCTDAIWSPKKDLVAFFRSALFSPDDGIYVRRGGGPPQPILKVDNQQGQPIIPFPSSWAHDGSGLIVTRMKGGSGDLLFLPISATGEPGAPRDLLVTPDDEGGARFSPDGRLVAFASNESGRREVYVAAYQKDGTLGPPRQVSKGDAGPSSNEDSVYPTPRLAWANDSRGLFYGTAVESIVMVTVQATPVLSASTPQVVHDLRRLRVALDRRSQWDILPDGQLIAIQKGDGEHDVASFSVVLNWTEELKQRVPTR
jgi:hypothetical protein